MQRLRFLIPAAMVLLFTGCFDINEEIDVRNNGSGDMKVNMDMSQLLEMMQTYMGKEELDKQMPSKAVDTTLLMKDVVDTAKGMSADKKALLRKGSVHMRLNMEQKLFKADIDLPFDNMANLQKLYTSMNDGSRGSSKLFKGFSPQGVENNNGPNGGMPDFTEFNGIYDFQCSEGLITRKLNAGRWKTFQESPQFAQIKQVKDMGMDVPYTLVLSLPRPVKKVESSLATVSDDKKTVRIKYNFMDVFSNPEKFEYSVRY
jgi:hypothetical protein